MEERKGHRKHSKEFKAEAVRLVVEGGRPVIDVARCLGIHDKLDHPMEMFKVYL